MPDPGTESAPPKAPTKKPTQRKPADKKPAAEPAAEATPAAPATAAAPARPEALMLDEISKDLHTLTTQVKRLAQAQEKANEIKAAEVLFTAQRFNQVGTHIDMRDTAINLLHTVLFGAETEDDPTR